MPNILITGANRGIGLALAGQFYAAGHRVVPTYRREAAAQELFSPPAVDSRRWLPQRYDAGVPATVDDLAAFVSEKLGALDVLINNAAMNLRTSGYARSTHTLGEIDADVLVDFFATNTIAPLILTQSLLPALRRSARPVIVNILSSSGSIQGKDRGGNYGYAMSKAALSMATKALALDLAAAGFIVVGIHPGWVRTRMGGAGGSLTAAESAAFLIERIGSLMPDDNGALLNWDGTEFVA